MSSIDRQQAVRRTQQQLYCAGQQLAAWSIATQPTQALAFEQGTVQAVMLAYRVWLQELLGDRLPGIWVDSADQACRLLGIDQRIPELAELAQLEAQAGAWPAQLLTSYRRVWLEQEPEGALISAEPEWVKKPAQMQQLLDYFKVLAERFRQAQIPY